MPKTSAAALLCLALLGGCTSIAERYDAHAGAQGLRRAEVRGADFHHVVYRKARKARGDVLHIYLEGDGSPLINRRSPTVEPTPRRPVMPALMALDPGPAVLLGRPCYHGLATRPPCQPEDWTQGRFSAPVVNSLATAARGLIAAGGYKGAVLIGHSGGGVLALLMAPALPQVRAVIAIATVADTGLWIRYHKLAPLTGSLNPNSMPSASRPVVELFLGGAKDRVTPLSLIEQAVDRRPQAGLWRYEDFDHACCWARVWPQALSWAGNPR